MIRFSDMTVMQTNPEIDYQICRFDPETYNQTWKTDVD